jgi:hypothetical protein
MADPAAFLDLLARAELRSDAILALREHLPGR